ncbi:MAG: hypothetical protein KAI73_05165 [Rhodospirillaceae bacterium]|nr:hypothetical protein [Rhodospirillaceae bacterium]
MSIPANRTEELTRTVDQEEKTLDGLLERRDKARKAGVYDEETATMIAICQTTIEEAKLELKLIGEANYAGRDD